MAVVSYTPRSTTIVPSVSTGGPFLVGFRLFDSDGLTVFLDGEETAAFTVAANFFEGFTDGASVLLHAPVSAGTEVRIEGDMKPQRQADYVPTDRSLVQKMNVEMGRIWAVMIELSRDTKRALRTTTANPPWDATPGTVPLWDGTRFIDGPSAGTIAGAEGYAVRAEAAAALAMSSANFTVASLASLKLAPQQFPVGSILMTREEGFSFEVVASNPDLTTAGGVFLHALPDREGFVHVEQFGAIPDGNRLTGTGTDNTAAFRRAFATPYNIAIGFGTFAVRNTIQNLKENRVVKGAGAGMITSAPIGDRLYFNAPTCILALGDAATPRIITRRKYRANAAAPNDPPFRTVLENWGAGSTFKDFSIELFCDYTNMSPSNLGAAWDIGFFNGCRSNVGCDHVTILGYFRAASFYWDVTDAYGIPNLLDIYGIPVPFPTLGDDDGPEYGRGSGSDGCWMNRCEARGRLPRVILGPDRNRTGGAYYDWVSNATWPDERGQSGISDFRSRDCALRAEHHSLHRMADPIGYGGTLTYAQMMAEGDFTPAAQYIDSGITNGPDVAGPTAAARGIVLDDLRCVTREPFSTRLGQVKELYFGPRVWAESNGTPPELYDTSGNDIYENRINEGTHFYGHLCTNEDTGRVIWPNTVTSIFTRWVYDWNYTLFTDRQGRTRGYNQGIAAAPAGQNGTIKFGTKTGGYITVAPGGVGSTTVLPNASALLYFDTASTPALQAAGHIGPNVTILAPSTEPTNGNTPDGNISFSAFQGEIKFRNRLAAGATNLAWSIL